MIFKSRQVNLDPEPWVCEFGCGHSTDTGDGRYQPRPEYEPTRDPKPWEADVIKRGSFPYQYTPRRWRGAAKDWDDACEKAEAANPGYDVIQCGYLPRREQFDTPVNPILVAFRADLLPDSLATADAAMDWLTDLSTLDWSRLNFDPTPEQIDHARRVLARLARMEGR